MLFNYWRIAVTFAYIPQMFPAVYENACSSKIEFKYNTFKTFSTFLKVLYGSTVLHTICHHGRSYSNKKRKMIILTIFSKNSIQVWYYFRRKK